MLAVGMLGVLAYGLASAATTVDLSVPSWNERYFSPNGDDQEDTATVLYCLGQSANITTTVTDDGGARVRTIEEGVSRAGNDACWNNQVTWDGKDDAGRVVAAGVYTLRLHAVDAGGGTGDASVRLGVEVRAPGALTSPSPGDTVSGTMHWVFAPATGFQVDSVAVNCRSGGGGGDLATAPAGNGTFAGDLDTATCADGSNKVDAWASWHDPFGQSHSWLAPAVEVTVANPPRVAVAPWSERSFSPNGDEQEDTATVFYCLSETAKVDAKVVDADGSTLRTLESGVSHGGSPVCNSWNNSVEWDGKNDAGKVVAAGTYTLRLHAVDATGKDGDASVRLGVDLRVAGALTSPAAGDTVSDSVRWVFTPMAGFDVDSISVSCRSGGGSDRSTAPAGDGTFTGNLDTTGCASGSNKLDAWASWHDSFGQSHSWLAPAVEVTVGNPPRFSVAAGSERFFSPNGDDQEDTARVNYCLSTAATVTASVTGEGGSPVRTLEPTEVTTGSPVCNTWNNSVAWDGKDDAGKVVAAGTYTLKLHAVDAAGKDGEASVRLGVDLRVPGALTSPAAGDTVSDTLTWVFTPTAGFQVDSVSVSCEGAFLGSSSEATGDGTFRGSSDSTGCRSGANKLTASASWRDPFGQGHSWASAVEIMVGNAPRVAVAPGSERSFSPNGDDQEDTATVSYCVSAAATVTASITADDGSPVRTLEPAEVTGGLACNSWNNSVAWDGKDDAGKVVTAGVYTLRLHAVDAGGRTGDASVRLGVDPRIPGALTSPAAGETLAGLARFVFQPTSGFGLDEVQLSFDTGGSARIFNASPDGTWRTSMYTGDLKDGPTSLRMAVRFSDSFGATHWWNGPTVPVVIDATGLPLTAVADPPAGPAPLATTFHLTTSDPQGRAVHYSVDFGDGTSPAGGEVAAPYPAVDVAHTYASPGAYRAVVTATNAAGAAATKLVEISATGAGNTAPDASLALDATSGSVPFPVKAAIAGSDAERDPLTYTLDFGDGTTPVRGDLPQDPVGHTYDKVGTYLIRLAVSDGKLSTVKTATVVVGLDEPLAADAGDDQVAVVGSPVHFDGSNSRPAAGIDAYHWTFGAGAGADGAVADHSYAAAGSYTATLTVTAGGHTEKDTAVVVVHPQTSQSGLVVSAKDEGGAPVPDTSLVVIAGSGQRYSATTDDRGDGVLQGLPDGSYTIYAWKQGYLPAKATGTVSGNAGSATVTLKTGQVATASLSSSPMTLDEVIAAGIDPTDPANQHVFEFTVHLAFETSDIQMSGYTASGGFPLCPRVEGAEVSCGPSGASFTTESYHVSVSVNYAHNRPQLVWLVIPGKASWLKEFFSVQMMVSNLADPEFILDHGSATLAVPGGLALAPTAIQQQPRVAMRDIPGGQSTTATWVLRGDTEGFYDLTASYAGTLEPFGETVTVHAATDKQLHVWGGSALELTVEADDEANEHYPYHVTVGLKNVADVPVYNPSLQLLTEGKKNYIYQPREQLVVAAARLAPGDTLDHKYVLVPTVSGTLDLAKSFVSKTAGDVEAPSKITSHPAADTPGKAPAITTRNLKGKVGLAWDPVAGAPDATDYAIYTTPDPATDFPGHPAANVTIDHDGGQLRAVVRDVPEGTKAWYAVSPLIDGQPMMRHPLVTATSTSEEAPSPTVKANYNWPSNSDHTCGPVNDGTVTFTFKEPFFDLRDYRITVGDDTYTGALAGHEDSPEKPPTVKLDDGQQLTITAQATNSVGDQSRVFTTTLDTDCERETAVVVAMGLNSSLDAGGKNEPDLDCERENLIDNFNKQAATNACDAPPNDPKGNLISYLRSKGYDDGESRLSPNRTLLEFSYNGARTFCGAKPLFELEPYRSDETWRYLVEDLAFYRTSAASRYVDALRDYSRCWKRQNGRELTFHIVGHSEGGYEAMAMAYEVASKAKAHPGEDYEGLISSVVTVDGALHPHVVLPELNVSGCWLGLEQPKLPADVAKGLIDDYLNTNLPGAQWAKVLAKNYPALLADWLWSGNLIRTARDAGIKVATVTNHFDGCLSPNATLNDAADHAEMFRVNHGTTGEDGHRALLTSHAPPTHEPGYPLTALLDSGYLPSAARLAPRTLGISSSERSMLAAAAETGRLVGRVVDPETSGPVAAGQVVAHGSETTTYTSVQEDGTFSFDALPVGAYRLFVQSFHGSAVGTWVGGPGLEGARSFAIHTGTNDAGDVAGIALERLTVRLNGADGKPTTDGYAVLVDDSGRQAARGTTDADGIVTLTAPPGNYSLGAASPTTAAVSTTVDLTGPANAQLTLEPAAVVTATVKDEQGAPLPSVAAALYLGEKVVAVGFTGPNGTYTFTGLEPGNYTVKLYEALNRFELPEVVLPATAKIGDPSAGQVTYTLDQATVAITSGPPPAGATVGVPYAFSFTASGLPAPTFSLASGRLPDGLTLDAAGRLSGAPTTAGTYTFSVTATNPTGTATGGPYTITVDAKPAVTSGAPPAGSVGVPYDFAFTASGAPAPSFALASGALPDGLALDQDGRLHGTPTREGSYSFSVSAQNRAGSATAGPYTMVIDVPLGVDQVVSFDRTTSAVQLRSPAMAVSAGELVLAHVSADGPSGRRQQVASLTGGGLRWSLAARSNTGRGTAEIWQATTTQAIGQLRVTAELAHDGYHGSITVASFKGALRVVSAGAAAGSKGAPGVKLTPTRDRSLVWAAGHDATRAQAPVPLSGQTIVHQFLDTRAKDTFWTQRLVGPTTRGVPVRMGASMPTRDQWQMVAVELAPTGG